MTAASTENRHHETAPLDSEMIESLARIMSGSEVRSLLLDMERDVRLRLNRLAEVQVAAGSLTMIAQDAHDLKSMGGNFGLIEMSKRAGVLERAARSECIESVRAGMPLLLSIGKRSLDALQKRPEITGGRAS